VGRLDDGLLGGAIWYSASYFIDPVDGFPLRYGRELIDDDTAWGGETGQSCKLEGKGEWKGTQSDPDRSRTVN
jgi:hypothetical protein